MSITGISADTFLKPYQAAPPQDKFQNFQQEFQRLGQDLKSGNLFQAQSDFATLQQNAPAGSLFSASSPNSIAGSNPIAQAFQQLSQDLQSGNLSGAQSDFVVLQKDIQLNAMPGARGHHHHHRFHTYSSDESAGNAPGSAIDPAFGAVGQALQNGSLASAQQAYAALQRDFQRFAANAGGLNSSSGGSLVRSQGSVNVTV
jgi:hypothetical protein